MSGFVIRRHPLLLVRQQHRLALGAHQDLVLRKFEVVHHDLLAIDAGCVQRGFVDHVGQVGSAESRCSTGKNVEVDVVCDGNLLHVYAENFFAAANVGQSHHHAAVETAGAQQRGIENVRPVGRGDKNHAVVRFESVHLDEQLVQRLLALIVSAAEACATVTADSIDFVDEDDAGRVLLALLKQIADAACADADKHFNEVRTGDREERHIRFAGNRTGQQRLAGSRRSDEQHALGNASAELLELLRLAQVLDDFLQLFLGFIHAGHVFERDLLLLHREQASAALAERKGLVAARLHLPQHEEPDRAQQHERAHVEEQRQQRFALRVLLAEADVSGQHRLVEVLVRFADRGVELLLRRRFHVPAKLRCPGSVHPGPALLHLVVQLGVGDFRVFTRADGAVLDHAPQQHKANEYKDPEHDRFNGRIHQDPLSRRGEAALELPTPPASSL